MQEWLLAHYDVLKDFAGPLVTLLGLSITTILAIAGLKTFARWRWEFIEARRIDLALEVLAAAHESKFVFGQIRDPNGFEGEWSRMPVKEGESPEDRSRRGGSYAILVRLNAHADYFERVSRLQPKAIAVFGAGTEAAFQRLSRAYALVRDAAIQLTWQMPVHPQHPTEEDFAMRMRLRGDLWEGFQPPDRVETELSTFRSDIETLLRPIIAREFQRR
jgi:hypothetical protein